MVLSLHKLKELRFVFNKWFYFYGQELTIVKMNWPERFVVDDRCGQRSTTWPVWNWERVKFLVTRFWWKADEDGK